MSSRPLRAVIPEASALDERYQFVRELGRGAMGIVYLASDRVTGQEVAVKLLDARHAASEDAVRRFVREAKTVSALAHPRIVRTLAIEPIANDGIAIVSQYVPGETLRSLLRREGALPFDRATAILRDVAAALAHAHRARIVHRDVKPENIFMAEPGGEALLADFGIARAIDGDTQITTADLAIGTPSYMAPEQIAGLAVDERADVYSLGLVGWEMVSGGRPWAGETLYSILHKQQHEPLPSLAALRPDIPAFLLSAIDGATSKARDRRWRDGAIFLARLTPVPIPLPESHRGRSVWEGGSDPSGVQTLQLPSRVETTPTPVETLSLATVPPDAEARPTIPDARVEPPTTHADTSRSAGAHRRRPAPSLIAAALIGVALVSLPLVAREGPPDTRPTVATRRVSTGDVASTLEAHRPAARLASVTVLAPPRPDSLPTRGDSTLARDSTIAMVSPDPSADDAPSSAVRRGATSSRPTTRRRTLPRTASVPPTRDPRCRSARRQDQSACLMGHVAVADVPLNRTYRAVISALRRRAGGKAEPASVRTLRREQRAWLVRRDAVCRQRVRAAGRPLWGLERAPCYAALSRQREAQLRARMRRGR